MTKDQIPPSYNQRYLSNKAWNDKTYVIIVDNILYYIMGQEYLHGHCFFQNQSNLIEYFLNSEAGWYEISYEEAYAKFPSKYLVDANTQQTWTIDGE